MVLACESIFSRTSLDGRPRNLHTFSKVNLKYTKRTFPVGQARCSFHLPHSYNLQFLLARGNGASTNVEPCILKVIWSLQLFVNCFLLFPDPFADAQDNELGSIGTDELIHIRIQQRNGRKTLTTVQGINPKYDLKKIVRACKKVSVY